MLANLIEPPIKVYEAKQTVEILAKIGLIKRDNNGVYVVQDKVFDSNRDKIKKYSDYYMKKMIELGKKSIDKTDSKERLFKNIVLSISKTSLPLVKKAMEDYLEKLIQICINEKEKEASNIVLSCNTHIFNLSKPFNVKKEM